MKEALAILALLLLLLAFSTIMEGIAMKRKPVVAADRRNATTFFIWGLIFIGFGVFFIYLIGGPTVTFKLISNMAILLWPS